VDSYFVQNRAGRPGELRPNQKNLGKQYSKFARAPGPRDAAAAAGAFGREMLAGARRAKFSRN
jgi:hypothetical protein